MMLNVVFKPKMLSVIMLSVIMLSVIMPSVIMLSVALLSVFWTLVESPKLKEETLKFILSSFQL